MIKTGIQVKHPIYGIGTVEGSRYGGFQLYVRFQNGKKVWLRQDELSLSISQDKLSESQGDLSDNTRPKSNGNATVRQEKKSSFKSRRMIEAFRLGIVPFDCVEDFTFGRHEEIGEVKQWLGDQNDSSLVIYGDYGTGKTHLFNHIYALALQSGYAVAYVSMSQDESPFHKPKRVYAELVKTFRALTAKETILNYRQFIRSVLDKGGFQDHIYFRHLANGAHDVVWDWIEANEAAGRPVEWIESSWGSKVPHLIQVPGLYDQAKAANIYCYLLSSLGYAAKRYFGLKGLLLLFDESEWIDNVNYTYQQLMAYNFLKGLILTANEDRLLLSRPYESIQIYDLEYARYAKDTPFLYKNNCGLKLLFAFTDSSIMSQVSELQGFKSICLSKLGIEFVQSLSQKLCSVYVESYPDFIFGELDLDLEDCDQSTRIIVKKVVESLDIHRFQSRISEQV